MQHKAAVANGESRDTTLDFKLAANKLESAAVEIMDENSNRLKQDPSPNVILSSVEAIVARKEQLSGMSLRQLLEIQHRLNGALQDVTKAMERFAN